MLLVPSLLCVGSHVPLFVVDGRLLLFVVVDCRYFLLFGVVVWCRLLLLLAAKAVVVCSCCRLLLLVDCFTLSYVFCVVYCLLCVADCCL